MKILKRSWKYILVAIIAMIIGSTFGVSTDKYNKIVNKHNRLADDYSELQMQNKNLNIENENLTAKVKEAEPFFKMNEAERKRKEEEEIRRSEAAADKARIEEEKKAQEVAKLAAEEKRKAEEKEKQGYNTGITYNQLARTPDKYMGEKVKFRGKVVQVMEGDDTVQIRLAVDSNYDTILFAEFDSSIVDSRVLEDDVITVMGLSTGLISYDSTMGGKISIPGVVIDKIDQ
ncbi:toxin regulator [Gottfriedia acidiceleris]|uniref:toxin regulator n=1 Tax=Gottfriedia acidiceleris TaxID=371036 RepID=UPI0033999D0A